MSNHLQEMSDRALMEATGAAAVNGSFTSNGHHYQDFKKEVLRRLEERERKIKQLEDILRTTQRGFAEYVAGVQSCNR